MWCRVTHWSGMRTRCISRSSKTRSASPTSVRIYCFSCTSGVTRSVCATLQCVFSAISVLPLFKQTCRDLTRLCVTAAKVSHPPTFLPVAQGNTFSPLTTPGDTGLGCARRGASERHVCSLSHHHVRAGRVIQDVRRNCMRKKSKYVSLP